MPLLVMHFLSDRPRYGNEIMEMISEWTRGQWVPNPGAIYPLMDELEENHLIRGEWEDPEKRTVAPGALWLEESLPPETLLIGLLEADKSRKSGMIMHPHQVLEFALQRSANESETILQFGGQASVGRGRCRLLPA